MSAMLKLAKLEVSSSSVALETQYENNWKIVSEFLKKWSFTYHHKESFANFINTIIPETVCETAPFELETANYKFSYKFIDVYLHKPCITEHDGSVTELLPMEARHRNLTYSSPLFARVSKKFTNKLTNETTESIETINPGNIPIMVKSVQCRLYKATNEEIIKAKECIYDQGGYFIVNGTEKVIMGMERMCPNTVYVFPNKHDKDDIYSEISSMEERARKAPVPFYVHQTVNSQLGRKAIKASINYFKKEFPIGILLKALGMMEFKNKILNHKLFSNLEGLKRRELETLVEYIYEDSYHIKSQEDAFKYLNKISTTQGSTIQKVNAFINAVLEKEFLPHIGIDNSTFLDKAEFVVYMIQSLLLPAFDLVEFDDHDHYKNKRVDVSGPLIGSIFKQSWAKLDRELKIAIRKKMETNNIKDIVLQQSINNTHLTKDLNHVLATGNWAVVRSSRVKTGVSQVLNRFNYQSYLSHCRRLINPMPKNSVLSKPRLLHNSSYGLVCPAETPEGHSIGLVKNMALLVHVSIAFNDRFIYEILEEEGLYLNQKTIDDYKIFLNGKFIGFYENDHFFDHIKELKLNGTIPYDVGVYYNNKKLEINIMTDGGRLCRPLLVVKDNKVLLTPDYIEKVVAGEKTWMNLLQEGIIELLDSAEQECALICDDTNNLGTDKLNYTHAEIHPATIFGVCANTTPFANRDPAARTTYNSSMAKQSVSVPTTNFNERMDTLMHALHYPQKPLCQTKTMEDMLYTTLPGGKNLVVAVTTYGGWNMEDSTILNQSSIDRGMFRSTFYKTYKDTESKITGADEKFGIPRIPRNGNMDIKGIEKLGNDGIISPGAVVSEGDILIGKYSMTKIGDDFFHPKCVTVKSGDEGVIDKVMISINPDGTRMVKIRIRQERIPEIGDKFAAPHSQKGVCGITKRHEDMPFTSKGIVPDLIFNCHSVPTRMTIGHLAEIWGGKNAALQGKFQDATSFEERNLEDISQGLLELGYSRYGNEVLYDGATGEMMKAKIFFGSCYYNRLKHMVHDKLHGRSSRGPITTLTHQPAEGKAREGGLRIGEMERDAFISLGASKVLQQRLMNLSDKFKLPICSDCGLFAICNPEKKIYICKACKSKKVVYVHIPYATKQLFLSLYALGIAPRILVEKDEENNDVKVKDIKYEPVKKLIK